MSKKKGNREPVAPYLEQLENPLWVKKEEKSRCGLQKTTVKGVGKNIEKGPCLWYNVGSDTQQNIEGRSRIGLDTIKAFFQYKSTTKSMKRQARVQPPRPGQRLQALKDQRQDITGEKWEPEKYDIKAEQVAYLQQVMDVITYQKTPPQSVERCWWMDHKAKLASCGNFLGFLFTLQTGKKILHDVRTCKWTACPFCSWRKATKAERLTMKAWERVQMEKYRKDKAMYHGVSLVFTIPNVRGDELKNHVDIMLKAFDLMQRRKAVSKICKGFIRNLEITRNNDPRSKSYGTYHPHFHVVWMVTSRYFKSDDYLSRDKITEIWNSCLRSAGYTGEPVTNKVLTKKVTAENLHQVFKYNYGGLYKHDDSEGEEIKSKRARAAAKAEGCTMVGDLDFDAETIKTMVEATAGRKLWACGGALREVQTKVKAADIETDDERFEQSDELAVEFYAERHKDHYTVTEVGEEVKPLAEWAAQRKAQQAERKKLLEEGQKIEENREEDFDTMPSVSDLLHMGGAAAWSPTRLCVRYGMGRRAAKALYERLRDADTPENPEKEPKE